MMRLISHPAMAEDRTRCLEGSPVPSDESLNFQLAVIITSQNLFVLNCSILS
jgi:hypothetical protein